MADAPCGARPLARMNLSSRAACTLLADHGDDVAHFNGTSYWLTTRAYARRLIAEQFGVFTDRLTDAAKLDDLGADSLDRIELTIALEGHFAIDIGDEEAARWQSVADVLRTVAMKVRT